MILEPPKPRRRAFSRFIWPAVITAAAVVAVVVSGAGTDTRAQLDYLGVMHDQATELSVGGDSLRLVISRLARVERAELVTATEAIAADLETAMELVEAGPPSDSLIAANALYRHAIESWGAGVAGFTSGILDAADDPNSTVAVDNIANSLAVLRNGDRLYAELVEELAREGTPAPVAAMPEVVMVPAEGELVGLSLAYVEAARAVNSGIALRPGLTVSQIVSDPVWAVNPTDQPVLPATETVSFSVVITNLGNVESGSEPLELTLNGASEPVVVLETVPVLEPGEQTAIQFLDLEVEPGGIYEVIAELKVVGVDLDYEDNMREVVFSVNEDEGG
ncbi:MAG TPA: hypothetical protein VFZ15_05715 [Acidimicrobiia bacterium]|nr:hypothetical protein [Acidimicrobiia bacterium]